MLFKFNHRRNLTIVSSHLDRQDRARLGLPGHKLFLRCDGKSDQEQLLEAIDFLPNNPGGNIKYTWGSFDHSAEVPIEKSAVLIQGAGKATEIELSAVGINGFVFGDGSTERQRSGIRDIRITSSVTKNGGSAIKFNKVRYGYASGLYIDKQYYGIEVAGASIVTKIDHFEIIDSIATNGIGVLVDGGDNVDVFLSSGLISASGGSEPAVGIALKDISGAYLSDISIAFMKYGVNVSPDGAGDYVEYILAHKVLADTCTEDGWGFGPAATYTVRGVWLDHCWGCTCKYGFNMSQAGTIYAVYLDHPIAINNDEHGIYVATGSEVHIRDPHATDNSRDTDNTYSGVHIGAGVSDWSIKGGRSTDDLHIGSSQQKYGIEVAAGASDNYQIEGVDVRGNQTAGIIDGGTGTDKSIKDNPGSTIDGLIADPGDAGAIPVTQSGHVALVTGGAETRTMAIPSVTGTEIHLSLKTDGGDCVVTVAGPVNVAGNTVLTFDNESEHILLKAIDANGTLEWSVVANDGVGLGP